MNPQKYSFDTSALIDGLERFYPPFNFPALWQNLDRLIGSGRVLISEEVWREATSVASATKAWCEDGDSWRNASIYPNDLTVARVVGQILAQYPTWVTKGQKNAADPFVIAVAEVGQAMVVSGEKDGGPSNPKIPYVCKQRAVPCGRFIDVIKLESWRFS